LGGAAGEAREAGEAGEAGEVDASSFGFGFVFFFFSITSCSPWWPQKGVNTLQMG